MDRSTLEAARPDEVASAAEAYEALAEVLKQLQEDWRQSVSDRVHASGWHGTAGELATWAISAAAVRLHSAEAELELLHDTLREAAEAIAAAQSEQEPEAGDRVDRAVAARLAHHTARAVESAPAGARRPGALGVAALDGLPGGRPVPPPGTPPGQVAAWWRGLDRSTRNRLTDTRPELVGSLDGLPALDRDRANRLLLTRLLDRYEQLPAPDRQLLDGLRAIRRRLAAGPATGPGRILLLGLSDQGRGRAVLCFGDPDRADHVAAYVPGFGTKLAAAAGGDADRAQRVREAALGYGQGRDVAALVWLGYDPPPNEGLDPRTLAVAGDGRARDGSAAYGSFLAGLRAARTGPPAHVTALGHSYGSLLVGLAAQRPGGLAADEVVLVGSPGTGARRADQFGLGPEHVYVGAADCDPVSRLPGGGTVAGGMLAGGLPGVALREVLDPPDELWFGRDPAGSSFGARRFQVTPGTVRDAFASHSAYFDGSSESLANIARVVAGRGDEVTGAPGR
ncbi:alpha/beta hydrolase [Kitasatospora sp. MAP5-34]|uniref:alpha/beta hydrolase n=1 Tax=Kitasatospora sp. MAP5-34 TaxID=3035102 RepID=UPI00247383D3|nr:alpha/beta hydrolase [Kitasatospora sp. MAP5-34]MDH6579617.1 hypothetical protein [Kitasatospora sp. MAP5-34]